MDKKTLITTLLLLIMAGAIVLLVLMLIDTAEEISPKEKAFFTDNPREWVAENINDLGESIKIDTYRATEGNMKLEKSQQNIILNKNLVSFIYGGSYKGNAFQSEYLPEDFQNRTQGLSLEERRVQADEEVKMQVTDVIKNDDGIIQGFVMAREEQGKLVFYIFIDSDWRRELRFTNIVWGNDFRNKNTLFERPFDFSIEEEGLAVDKMDINVDWYKGSVVRGGMVIGEVTKETLDQDLSGETKRTFMVIR